MRRSWSLVSISRLAIAAYGVMFILLVAGLVSATRHMRRLHEEHADAIATLDSVTSLEPALVVYQRAGNHYLLAGDPAFRAQRDAVRPRIVAALDNAERYVGSAAERAVLSRLRTQIDAYFDLTARGDAGAGAVRAKVADERGAAYAALEAGVRELVQINVQYSSAVLADARRWDISANWFGALFALAFVAVSVAVVRVVNSLYVPLRTADQMITHQGANLQAHLPEEGVAELKGLARAYNRSVEELRSAKGRQLEFLAGVAHDLRNPLTAMLGNLEMLRQQPLAASGSGERIETLLRQVARINAMVDDLLDASNIESGRLALRIVPVDLCALVHDCVALFGTSQAHPVTEQLPATPLEVRCDPLRISQVLNNLLSNAIKYSPAGSAISVTMEAGLGVAAVTVTDQGIGVAPDERESIFEPFHRSQWSREAVPGLGLGLSVSRKIIEAHGGELRLVPHAGRGTKMQFTLPLPA